MRFKRVKWNWGSLIWGVHYGRNPVSGQRFVCVAPCWFVTIDFELAPYVNDAAKAVLDASRAEFAEAVPGVSDDDTLSLDGDANDAR